MHAFVLATLLAYGIGIGDVRGQPAMPPKPVAPTVSEWMRGNKVLLGVTQEQVGFSAQWRFQRLDNGDIVLDMDEQRAGRPLAGSLILVGSGAVALKSFRPEQGKELDVINGPLMMLQLTLRLLERSVPAGPQSLTSDRQVAIAEQAAGVKTGGIGTDGEFFAPWSLKGTIGPGGKGLVKFDLEFSSSSHSTGGKRYETAIVGIWQQTGTPLSYPDGFSLRGWRVHQIKNVVKPRGMFNTVGVGTSSAMVFGTLGDLRRAVTQWATESENRSRHQCN
jgi:hypothetical protein